MNPTLYWIEAPFSGKLAVSARPRGGDWLEDEVAGWRRAGVDGVTSLLTQEEVDDLHLAAEGALCQAQSIHFRSFPITDRSVPSSQAAAVNLMRAMREDLEAGQNIAVHCRQGIGRSGLIAAGLLVNAGLTPDEALQRVSQARGLSVPETPEQREWIVRLSVSRDRI